MNQDPLSKTARTTWLSVILVVAFGMRMFRIGWGVPEYVFPDTLVHFLQPAAGLVGAHDFGLSQSQFFHPPVLVYVVGLVIYVWSTLTGTPVHASGPGLDVQLPTFVLLGRGLCVLLATASVAVLYLVARRLVGARAALIAAAAFALSPIHVLESHRIHPEEAAILLALLAGHQALIAQERRSRVRLLAAFALTGLAGATKYTGVLAVTLPAWIAFQWANATMGTRIRLLVAGGFATLAGLGLGLAPALWDAPRFASGLRIVAGVGYLTGMAGTDLLAPGWVYHRYLYPVLVALPYVMGWAVYLAALPGFVVLARSNRWAFGVLAAGAGPLFLFQGGAVTVVPRYFLPLAPYLALGAGIALDRLWTRRERLGPLLTAIVLVYTALMTGSQCLRLGLGPQTAVGRFVGERARAAATTGSTLVIGYSDFWWWWYDTVRPKIEQPGVHVVYFPETYRNVRFEPRDPIAEETLLARDRQWVHDTGVDIVILPDWLELAVVRERPDGYVAGFYRRLADGRLGFRLAAYFRTHYFTEGLYVWAEPMYSTHWETAISGYKVFVRENPDRGADRSPVPDGS